MAEGDNDQDLVSQIKVEGGAEAAAEIEKFADQGAAAFDKLAAATGRSSEKMRDSFGRFTSGARDAERALGGLDKAAKGANFGPQVTAQLAAIEQGAQRFGASLATASRQFGRFAARFTALAAGVQATAIAFVEGARRIAVGNQQAETSFDKLTKAQIEANNRSLEQGTAARALERSQQKLRDQLATGAITYAEYAKAMRETTREYDEQQREANIAASAAKNVEEANERLKKSAEDRKAYEKLVDTFGGPLTQSLVAFGRQVENVRVRFLAAFGPGLAQLVDTIGQTLTKNTSAVDGFFTTASQKISEFVQNNGPAIEKAIENIAAGAKAVFEGLIEAGPSILNFFNNGLVPAVQSFVKLMNGVATVINKIFGTELTGGAVILIGLFIQLSGGVRLLFTLIPGLVSGLGALIIAIGTLTGIAPLLIAVIVGIGIALATLDWSSVASAASNAWNAIKSGASGLVAYLRGLWTSFTTWFVGLFAQDVADVKAIWNLLVTGASLIVTGVKAAWTGLTAFFQGLWDGVVAIFDAAWAIVMEAVGTVVQGVMDAWNDVVAFFQGIPGTLQGVWDSIVQAIQSAFSSAVNYVKNAFSQLLSAARSYLQPIIDMLNSIISLGGKADAAAGGAGGAGFRQGGKVTGPGTGTSDSILARLSNGEFVVKARMVAKYGTDLLNAINQGRFRMPEFALGGGVNFIAPALGRTSFADGGEVRTGGSLQPLNLTIDGQTFEGLMMPENVGRQIAKYAISRQTRSAGRKPSWVGSRRN